MTDADNLRYLALMSSIPVALLTLRFCSCWNINDGETRGISNSVPSGTFSSTKSFNLVQVAVCLVSLGFKSLYRDHKNSLK